MPFVSVNPATGQTLGSFPSLSPDELTGRLELAARAFEAFSRLDVAERARHLLRWGEVLRAQRERLALRATCEMGKPIAQSRAEVDRCVHALTFLAGHGPEYLAPEIRPSALGHAVVRFDPLGVVLGVMPWNFPYWQIVRFAAGAVVAGNVVLVKPAPSTAGCALLLEDAVREAGWPAGVYQTLLVEVEDLPRVVAHPAVAAVSLTGSVRAGRSLATLAAAHLKPAVLELGGSDALVVLDDADVDAAAETAARARCINSGQSCIAAKRFIVTAGVYDRFRDRFVEAFGRMTVGDPLDQRTDIGPLARAELCEQLHELVRRSRPQVRVLYPTSPLPLPGGGAFFPPTVLEVPSDVPVLPPVWTEETFGPVAVLRRAADADDAFVLAADSPYALGCSVWTADPDAYAGQLARLPAGSVFVNGMVRSTPELPFGGQRWSGYGRELGREGVRQFTNVKTVVTVRPSASA